MDKDGKKKMMKIEERVIYPNLNRENKFLGIIDYKSLILLLVYVVGVWKLSCIIFAKILFRIYAVIILSVPIVGLFYANKNEDNITHVIYLIFKYLFSKKLYVYKITSRKGILK